MRAKFYPLERKRGFYKCGSSRCQLCNTSEETERFSRSVRGETYKINYHLCCNEQCLIYLLTCKGCAKQLMKQLISFGRDGTTIKIVTGHF